MMEDLILVLGGLLVFAVGSGVAAVWLAPDDWLDDTFGPEERLGKCEARLRAPRRPE